MATATRLAHDMKSMTATLGVYAVHREAAALEQACLIEAADVGALAQNVSRALVPVVDGLQALGAGPVH
jgi:HPt (histidine-containing phosphotransfer) domain-containing protein